MIGGHSAGLYAIPYSSTEYPLTQKGLLCLLPGVLLDSCDVVSAFLLVVLVACVSSGWIGKQMLPATA